MFRYVKIGLETIKSMAKGVAEGGVIARKEAAFPRFARGELDEFIAEANKLLERGERTAIAQACEKFYKVTEEIIKILAEEHLLVEWREAEKIGRWKALLLHRAAAKLARIEGELIRDAWSNAWYLHTSGFHENLLDAEEASSYTGNIKNLVTWFNRRNIHR